MSGLLHGLANLGMPPGLDHLPDGKALEGLVDGLPGMHGIQVSGSDLGSASIHPIVSGDLLDPVGRQVSNLIGDVLPGSSSGQSVAGGPAAAWDAPSGASPATWGATATQGQPAWAHVPHMGRSDFDGAARPEFGAPDGAGRGDWVPDAARGGRGQGMPDWSDGLVNGVASDAQNLLGGPARQVAPGPGSSIPPASVEALLAQSGRMVPQGEFIPGGLSGQPLNRGAGAQGELANRVAPGDSAIPVDRQVTAPLPDGAQPLVRTETGAEPEVVEWRAGNGPDARVMQRDGMQNQIDPRMGWINRSDPASVLKLSLTVIPPVMREGEMTQSATRTALFRAVVDGQQAFIDSQGRIVGWAVRQDLAATYVAEVIQAEQLLQLPDGRQVVVDAQGRVRGAATGELLRPVKAALAADARPQASDVDERALLQRAQAHLRAMVWSTALPSCIGLMLVLAAFLSAAAVGAMPWTLHVLFLAAAIGLAVFCGRTWKRCNRLPDGSVTKLPAITRRIRVLMALSCSAQGAGAVLLGTAAVLF